MHGDAELADLEWHCQQHVRFLQPSSIHPSPCLWSFAAVWLFLVQPTSEPNSDENENLVTKTVKPYTQSQINKTV